MPAASNLSSKDPAQVSVVVQRHAEEVAMLRQARTVLVRAPHAGLPQLGQLDERIATHLEGLAAAEDHGEAIGAAALESPSVGDVFAAAVHALESRNNVLLERLVALTPMVPHAQRALISAFGWVNAEQLQGVVRRLLESAHPHEHELGIAACRVHGVDPGPVLVAALGDRAPSLRAEALRAAGALGRVDLLERVRQSMSDDAPEVVFWAARAACLLGDRQGSLRVLQVAAQQDTPWAQRGLSLVIAASSFEAAGELARHLSATALAQPGDLAGRRRLVRALGLLGDVRFVPWLIERMAEPTLARLAGEAFCWICGTDLAKLDLETLVTPPLPEHSSDDPADDHVSLDEDKSLPWPDPAKVQSWWQRHHATLAAPGSRLFCGEPISAAVAQRVLREGSQRLRAHAAEQLCLLQPGARLFPVAAPAPRQLRWLAGAR